MLYLFDLDGTLCVSYMTLPDKKYHTVQVMPNRREKLKELIDAGHQIGIVTNQGGVAFNMIREGNFERKIKAALKALGLPDDTPVNVCYHHPKARNEKYRDAKGVKRRKPSGDMIKEHVAAFPVAAADGVVYVGDRPEDKAAARDAGVQFQWEHQFFAPEKIN